MEAARPGVGAAWGRWDGRRATGGGVVRGMKRGGCDGSCNRGTLRWMSTNKNKNLNIYKKSGEREYLTLKIQKEVGIETETITSQKK